MVSSINDLLSSSGTPQDMLRKLQEGQEDLLGQTEIATATVVTASDTLSLSPQAISRSSNMMARNFASAEREESRYTQATIQGLQAKKQMDDNKQNTLLSIMQQTKMEYENAESSGEKYKALKRAEREILWHQSDEVRKSAGETHLKESKERLEEKIKEAMAPKDENSNPIETGLSTGSAGEAAFMPEISGSSPIPAPEVSAAPAPDVAAVAVSTPEVSMPSAPSTPSIDITV